MASGPCAAPTGRRHGRTDQLSQNSQINLANGEPSRHGAQWLALITSKAATQRETAFCQTW